MAKNDKVLLDGIIDDLIEEKLPSDRRGEAFEYFAIEQILKDADLSKDEIETIRVDGRDDGGIDGFLILVNGNVLSDLDSFVWPRVGSVLEVSIITCKHHDTFKQAPLDNLAASLTELFDFGLERDSLKGDYSDQVLKYRENLKLAYRKLSPRMSKFIINFSYASRGDTLNIGESVVSRSEQIKSIAKDSFSSCEPSFTFYGCAELIELHRKMPNYSLELTFLEVFSRGEQYVVLTKLRDYYHFVSDEGKLRKYLLDSNVRDFMGLNRVNEDIKATLELNDSPDFWWLNNGITILATSASVIGKAIKIQDIQIVNGLQTTESISRYFEEGGEDPKDRAVLVKIIVSNEKEVSDSIIRATNNQTDVELASLHATDKIQRDIEDVLLRNGLYYDRRKNYYVNLGHSTSDVFTPLYLASGYFCLILKSPHMAAKLKSKFMRSDESYNSVFSASAPINVWPVIATLLKKTDKILEKLRHTTKLSQLNFLKRWRQLTCLITVSRLMGTYDFSAQELAQFDLNKFTNDEIKSTWQFITKFDSKYVSSGNGRIKKSYVIKLCKAAADKFNLLGFYRIEAISGLNKFKCNKTQTVDMEFALKVDALLPPQPWKPGIRRDVMEKLKCTSKEYHAAVGLLIDEGIRNYQKDGIVYDSEGNVLCFDSERVDKDTMRLFSETDN